MDIDDILASVSGDDAASLPAQDLAALTRAWVAERVAPELLPYPEALMERISERIRKQIEFVEEQTGNMDPKTSFRLVIIQTELERFKYLVRCFLRARIAKIDKYPLHILQQSGSNSYLSASERQYLTAHQALLSSHYHNSFLSQFPPQLQRLDDTAGGISMVEAPDTDKAVFCRVLQDIGVMAVEGTDAIFEMSRGDVYVIRWSLIREKYLAGQVELI